jgi:hypothetical protein
MWCGERDEKDHSCDIRQSFATPDKVVECREGERGTGLKKKQDDVEKRDRKIT